MARWDVNAEVRWAGEVEANSEEEAKEKGLQRIADGSFDEEDVEATKIDDDDEDEDELEEDCLD